MQLLLITFLTAVVPFFSWAQGLKCVDLVSGRDSNSSHIIALQSLLVPTHVNGKVQTVFYRGETSESQIILVKPDPKSSWFTTYDAYESGGTLHGDPRNAIAVLGPELAQAMGYAVITNPNGSTTLLVPTARRLATFVKRVNRRLVARGLEPITYLPVGAGYVSDSMIVEMSARENKDGYVFFPFADRDTKLTTHEVSFHQFPIIYPKVFNDRAKRISLRYAQIINMLRNVEGPLKDVRSKIIALLENSRSIEIDYGYANTGAMLAEKRMEGKSYREIEAEDFSGEAQQQISYFLDHIQFTLQPNRAPVLAVAGRMMNMFGLKDISKDFFGHHKSGLVPVPSLTDETFDLSLAQKTALSAMIRSLIQTHLPQDQADFKSVDAFTFRSEMLKQLDQRIQDIYNASKDEMP